MLLTAPQIHNGYEFLPAGTVLEVDDDGTILAIHDQLQSDQVIAHQGILCPGFVNAHCHLELSHLKDMIPEHTGLIPFLKKVPSYRNEFTAEQVKAARHEAFHELLHHGVVAVGDISNVTDTLDLRALDRMHMHTFAECLGFTEQHAGQLFSRAVDTFHSFASQQPGDKLLRQSIVPHAPYSVSKTLFGLIDKHQPHALLSIHNQESPDEDEYYRFKTGPVRELLGGFGIDDSFFEPSGLSSLQTYTEWLSKQHTILFVHNTFTTMEDVQLAQHRFARTFWCLCPNANLYIENRLPDLQMMLQAGAEICIGTDSLASNHQLSIMSELRTLKEHFPETTWATLLQWATSNGAQALNMQERIGSLDQGKQPGIVNITGLETGKPLVSRIL